MCGRYHIESEEQLGEMMAIIEEISRKYGNTDDLSGMAKGEIFPTNIAPVISADGPVLMKWGYSMHDSKRTIINARSETAHEKPMFSRSLSAQRVAVPTNGFYEWTHPNGKTGDKYLFRLVDEEMLYLAGIYTESYTPQGKERRYVILTTDANDSMNPFHDRMPVCLSRAERDLWIGDSKYTQEALRRPQPQLMPMRVAPMPKAAQPEQISMF